MPRDIQIGDHTHQTTVVAQALVQNSGDTVLDHGGFDVTVQQHFLRRSPGRAIARVLHTAGKRQARAARQAYVFTRQAQQIRHQLRDLGFACRAANTHDRNTPVVLRIEQAVHDRTANRARLSLGGFEMHKQARSGIDLHDGGILFVQRAGNIFGDHIHPGNVQADDARRQFRHRDHLGMNRIGHVYRHVAIAHNQYRLAHSRDRVGGITLSPDFHARHGVAG